MQNSQAFKPFDRSWAGALLFKEDAPNTQPRSSRFIKIGQAFALLFTTHAFEDSRAWFRFAFNWIDPKTHEPRSMAGFQSYRIESGKLVKTWLSLQPLGSAWSDPVAQEHWTSKQHRSRKNSSFCGRQLDQFHRYTRLRDVLVSRCLQFCVAKSTEVGVEGESRKGEVGC